MREAASELTPAETVAPGPPILEARGLCYRARGARLIEDVSLAIRPGRTTVLLGANGAGKTLLLRLLHGLIAPDAGTLLWHGRPAGRAARRAQAMVFQRPVLLRRSVRANLAFALAVRRVPRSARAGRIEAALRLARLDHLAGHPARRLSGGEQQRLAIARALAARPEVLFLDEPAANLDPASTKAVEDLIGTARDARLAVVLVSHDPGQARRLADDAVFLHRGRVAEAGPAAQVLRAPRSGAARAWLDGRLYLDP